MDYQTARKFMTDHFFYRERDGHYGVRICVHEQHGEAHQFLASIRV